MMRIILDFFPPHRIDRLILCAYHSSNYNDSERAHLVVNHCLGSTMIGKQSSHDADVIEVGRRLQGASYAGEVLLDFSSFSARF
jgi:hypothetical protein